MGIGDFLGMRWVIWEGKVPPQQIFNDIMTFIQCGLSPTNSLEDKGRKKHKYPLIEPVKDNP
jgi:hypothetical protein